MRKRVTDSFDSVSNTVTPPGAFTPDGSFNPEGGWAQQGPTDTLVRSLVRLRQAGKLSTPAEAAQMIRNANCAIAFPYIGQWETCEHWWAAWSSTSAEDVVKRAGRGHNAT